jgi:hypothetical protein
MDQNTVVGIGRCFGVLFWEQIDKSRATANENNRMWGNYLSRGAMGGSGLDPVFIQLGLVLPLPCLFHCQSFSLHMRGNSSV